MNLATPLRAEPPMNQFTELMELYDANNEYIGSIHKKYAALFLAMSEDAKRLREALSELREVTAMLVDMYGESRPYPALITKSVAALKKANTLLDKAALAAGGEK